MRIGLKTPGMDIEARMASIRSPLSKTVSRSCVISVAIARKGIALNSAPGRNGAELLNDLVALKKPVPIQNVEIEQCEILCKVD